jgi:CRP-like cAMP-binding protein
MPKAMVYKKGALIYFEGDRDERVFILQKGLLVATSTDIESDSKISESIRPGEFFGTKSALGHFPREETISAMSDSVCIAMTVAEFEQNFSANKQVIMKMMRVFSGQLRQVHYKTESILKKSPLINQQAGMLSVAQAFYQDEKWRSCCDVCTKFLKLYPQTPNRADVEKILQIAKPRAERDDAVLAAKMSQEEGVASKPGALKAFSLPAFSRFSKTYNPGQVIISEFEPGDSFYLIQSGDVQLVKCINGTNKNLDILKPGEFFGEMAILDNSPRSATCLARTKLECLEFNKANFEVLIMGNPQLAMILLKLFCKRIYDQRRRFKTLCIKDVQARICDVFLMFDELNPMTNPQDHARRFSLSAQDVAHWAGLSPEVTREEMNKLVKQHKIEVFDNVVIVPDIVDLRRIVDTRTAIRER